MNRFFRLMILGGAAFVVTSCGVFKTELDKCYEEREYQAAKPGPRIRTPEDLEPLDEAAWVPIPYGPSNKVPTSPGAECLIQPPDYREQN